VASATITDRGRVGHLTLDVLSDDILLYIFDFYRHEVEYNSAVRQWSWCHWRLLVNVCQRWRYIIFAWPNHLNVQIDCRSGMAIETALDVWPALPISIRAIFEDDDPDGDDIFAALKHRERITEVDFSGLLGPQLESCVALMQETFPILRTLSLECNEETTLVISDTFLGGCAPRLRNVKLCYISFPTLPKLLLSASRLVELHLEEIPKTGYISPDAMATCLAMLTRLQSITISSEFWSPLPQNQTNQHPPPMSRAVLPSLTKFIFGGVSGEYLDDLMARIHLPLLNHLHLDFFRQPTLGVPKLPQIVHRIEAFKPPFDGEVHVYDDSIDITFFSSVGHLYLAFLSAEIDQLSWLTRIYPQLLPLVSQIDYLEISDHDAQDDQDPAPWLEFLRPFSAVRTLWVYDENSLNQIVRVLGEPTDERAAEVLPVLDTILWFDEPNDVIRMFPLVQRLVDARNPVVVHVR